MKKLVFIPVFIFLLAQFLSAQDYEQGYEKNNIIFGEIAGHGIILSVNYERFVLKNLSVRTGFGSLVIISSIPLMVNYYIGNVRKLELGAGVVYTDLLKEDGFYGKPGRVFIAATIGHAFHPLNGGVILRFSFTPMYNPDTKRVWPFAGISIGYKF